MGVLILGGLMSTNSRRVGKDPGAFVAVGCEGCGVFEASCWGSEMC